MALTGNLEVYPTENQYIPKIIEAPQHDVSNATDASDLFNVEHHDLCNSFQELYSCPESLALLQCLSSFDSTKYFSEKTLIDSDIRFPGVPNSAVNNVEDKDFVEPTTVNFRKYVDSSSTSVVTINSRLPSPLPCITGEQPQDKSLTPVSPTFLSPVISTTRSQVPPIQETQVEELNCVLNETGGRLPNKELWNTIQIDHEKSKKIQPDEDSNEVARELDIWGPPEDAEKINDDICDNFLPKDGYPTPILTPDVISDSRSAGIYAAAALFRRPSAASKKYNRAPISRLFMSLDITAEMFLKLQGAAKAYMLDENFPERRETVGTKRRTDNDFNKLKLYSLVKEFLEQEGWGERCYGSKAEGADRRKLKWPDSKNKIIKLFTPLMRRMVTNERQRRYAKETRMEKKLKNPPKRGSMAIPDAISDKSAEPEVVLQSSESHEIQNSSNEISSSATSKSDLIKNLQKSLECVTSDLTSQLLDDRQNFSATQIKQLQKSEIVIKYFINILQNGSRITKRLLVMTDHSLNFSLFIHRMTELTGLQEQICDIKVHGPHGLVKVSDENSWEQAILLVLKHEWMDQEIRCLINLEN